MVSPFSQTRKKGSVMLSDWPGPAGECTFEAYKTWKVHTSLCTCAIPLERASGALPWRGASCRPWLPAARLLAVVPLRLPFPLSAAWWGHTRRSPASLKTGKQSIPLPVLTVASVFRIPLVSWLLCKQCFFWCVAGCAVWSIPGKEGATTSALVQLEPAGSELRPPPLCGTV